MNCCDVCKRNIEMHRLGWDEDRGGFVCDDCAFVDEEDWYEGFDPAYPAFYEEYPDLEEIA